MSRLRALLLAVLVALATLAPARAGYDFERSATDFAAHGTALLTEPFTVACNFTPESSGVAHGLVTLGDVDVGHAYQLVAGSTLNAQVSATDGGGTTGAGTTNVTSIGTRSHFCGIVTSTTDRRSVLNGDWASSTQSTVSRVPTGLDNTQIGHLRFTSDANHADGIIEHVAGWSVALTQGEVESLAAGAHPFSVRRSALVFYVPLVGGRTFDLVGLREWTVDGAVAVESRSLRGLHGR